MLSVCGRGGGAVAAAEEPRGSYPLPPTTHPRPQQLGAAIDALLLNPLLVDEGTRLEIAQQSYNAGDYGAALEQSNAVYRENPRRLENLLLLGAVYYQVCGRHSASLLTRNLGRGVAAPSLPASGTSI